MLDQAAQFDHLTAWGPKLVGGETEFLESIRELSAVTKGRLKVGRKAARDGYELHFEFVSTGKSGLNSCPTCWVSICWREAPR